MIEYGLDELLIFRISPLGTWEYKRLEESAYYQALMHKDNYDKSTKIFTDYIGSVFKYADDVANLTTYNQFLKMYESVKDIGLINGRITIWNFPPYEPSVSDGHHRLAILKYLGFKKIKGEHGGNSPFPALKKGIDFNITSYE